METTGLSFAELAKARYSVRKFKEQPVEQEKIDQMLETMRIAPTAHNNQPQRVRVITAPEDLAMVDECTRCRFGAPLVFLICYDKETVWVRERYDGAKSGEVDASIITSYLMMQGQDLGLGSCWVMFFDPEKTAEVFNLPENVVPLAFLPMGYPAEDAEPSKMHGERFAMEDILL